MSDTLKYFLHATRWLAAFLVVLTHVRHLALPPLKDLPSASVITKGFYFFSGFGPEAVDVFFVASGFLVGGIALDRWIRQGSPDLTDYAASRISRIFTVLFPALLVVTVLDQLGASLLPSMYSPTLSFEPSDYLSPAERLTLPIFIGNLLSLQGIVVPPYGTNGPLWSLAFEVWYYIIFAIAAAGFFGRPLIRAISTAVAIICLVFVGPKIALWGLIWLSGVAAYFYWKSGRWAPKPILAILVFGAVMVLARLSHNQDNVTDHEGFLAEFARELPVALAFALLLVSIGRSKINIPLGALHKWLADFSFSTYIIHVPVLWLSISALQAAGVESKRENDIYGAVAVIALVLVSYVASYGFYLATEKHTAKVKALLLSAWKHPRRRGLGGEPMPPAPYDSRNE